MIAVILAAGMSKRLRPLTDNVPKCLLDIGNTCLLSRYLDLLEHTDVTKVIVITGFNSEAVEKQMFRKTYSYKLDSLYFPEYETTHPIDGFIFVEDKINDDFLLLNSDIYFTKSALDNLIQSTVSTVLIDSSAPYQQGEMFVNFDEAMYVTEISKQISERKYNQGKSLQITKFLKEDKDLLFNRANEIAGISGVFYPAQAFDVLIENKKLLAVDVAGEFNQEMDTVDDYQNLMTYLANTNK